MTGIGSILVCSQTFILSLFLLRVVFLSSNARRITLRAESPSIFLDKSICLGRSKETARKVAKDASAERESGREAWAKILI